MTIKVNLETDEKLELVIDDTCEFEVWGERNEEGTMIIKTAQECRAEKLNVA